ncbi:PERQ amino acid-rich with GYF domain-containing protein 1 isoform X2 [Pundamilia nyererei]|uniref:PERQ amino acid-rich with GYF domain-containing protein 1 isoform X2 n=1 Tax=Pundamilia nyererei TaxID=303518 RepID=A0A9Y6JHP9_9CICH|nr:PREDICTED: PERQ amino acid-rich with GYF domain-containing protein 1 isoform X2 [Pundamilia nyererei]
MTAETLNFGPEWLRALSSGGSVTSPPPSPAMPKYKLAEYRYGREEMLALYVKDNKVPEDMQDKEFAAILQEEPMQPLALVPLTEEEQRNFSMSVNSVAVLRLMGKGVGGAAPAGVVRGRGATRGGRGRGRGEGGFYQRSIEDAEVGFGRSVREIHRSQSWDDRGERRFEKPLRREVGRPGFEETGGPVGPVRKEYTRADSDNWRTLREEQEEDEGEPGSNWRLAGSRRDDGGPRSAGWRDHSGPGEGRRRKFDFDFRDSDGHGGGRRRAGSDGLEDDRDGLPEWCTDEEDGEMGTFDSSGAFMPMKKSGKETILEEFEFKGIEEEEEEGDSFADMERNSAEGDKDKEIKEAIFIVGDGETKPASPSSSPTAHCPPPSLESQPSSANQVVDNAQLSNSQSVKASSTSGEDAAPLGGSKAQLSPSGAATSSSLPPPPPSSAAPLLPPSGGDAEDDEGMKHLQQEAEKMVASLQDTSLEEECFTQALQQQESRNTAAALPLTHEAAMKWFYKDPQGEIQGPFTTVEMCEWFQAGYFTMTLLVKRGCDEGFQPLGDVIKMWGRVPFAPGPSPPPLLVRQLPPTQRPQPNRGPAGTGNLDQERLKKQQELAAAALYQQLQQQQQLFQLMNSEQSMMPSMNRSMSVPDTGSMWDMHTSASQPSGGEASLWDITMNPSTQGPTLEQLQKLQQERRDAELRAKREEEEQRKRREEKRRQQEEQKRREEEEIFRRKQCRQQQELIMKLLQQTPQQQGPGAGSSSWSGASSSGLSKAGKPQALALLEIQQETERLLKQQQRAQQQRDRHSGLSMGSSSMGGQWVDGVGMWGGPGSLESKSSSGGSSGSMGMWDEAVKNQTGLRGNSNNNMGLKNSRSSPSLSDQYMIRRKRTEEEEKLLKLLQGMKPQDGFTTWCEQMLHALNTSANNSSSSVDVATIVAYLKEVESPYAVLDFIRSYLGDTVEAKEFAKQFLERRAKQKANQQRQQQQLSKEVAGLNMNFPLQDSMRGMNPNTLQSMFQANHMGKAGLYDNQGGKMKKKQPMMLHSDPSILGYSFHNTGECMSLNEMEMVEDY